MAESSAYLNNSKWSNPISKGAVAAQAQEGLEELFHVGQEGQW